MKSKLFHIITAAALLAFPSVNYAQAPPLGTAANFVLFSTVGALSNTGITHLTGNVGTNSGLSTGFGNVDGQMHDNDGVSGQCAADLLIAYNQLNAAVPTFFPAPLLGNGQILVPGIYSISSAATMNLDLILDGQGNSNSVFIIQIAGPFSANANSKVKLINGAIACNVFWKIEGLVSLASGTTMRGTVIANNAAINMSVGDTLEGRALSTAGAITVNGILAYTPIGCGSLLLTGPVPPNLLSTACYTIFSSIGPVTNVGVTFVTGDIGSDNGLTTGYNPLNVTGMIHPIPDGSTAACASDLITVYNYLNLLPYDIELLYPAQFGNNLVLTPHSYLMNSACTFTDTLYLNAEGDPNAVFFIHINGALGTSTYSKVNLINGAQALNVFWEVNGAVTINDYSVFNGTIICNNGAMNLNTGVTLNGRALTTTGAISTSAITAIMPPGCGGLVSPIIITQPTNQSACLGDSVSFVVSATGSGLTYQWRRGNTNLVNGGNISGATNDTLTINPVTLADVGNNYNVIVYGFATPSDTSMNVSLTLNSTPVITTVIGNQTVCAGDSVGIVVTATGGNLIYQWRKGNVNLINAGNISGVTNDTLVINPITVLDSGSTYNVIVSTACGADTSINISIQVNIPPVIALQPSNQAVCAGDSASFIVTATGTNLTYQWMNGLVNVVNGVNISGATNDTLKINPAGISDASVNYHVIVSGTCGADTSMNVSLIINTPPVITTQPVNQSVCEGSSVSFSVVATGSGLVYQWRNGIVNLINAGNISGATTATLTINPVNIADASVNYNVVVTGTCPPNDTSINVSLAITPTPIALAGSNSPVCTNDSITLTAQTVVGATYSWTGPNGFTSTAQNPTILSASATESGNYILTVTNNGCTSASSTVNVSVGNCSVDLSVVKTVDVTNPFLGHTVVFTIVVTNNGPTVATGVEVTDVLQNGYVYVSSSATVGTYDPLTGVWTIGTLNNGATATLTVTVTVIGNGNYVNTAIVYGNETDPNTTDNNSTVETFPTDFFIPEGFSPNGDGINDLFVIRGISNYPENTFTIFNRWGNKVFEANPYTSTWDGKSGSGLRVGGDELPVGTYFYVLDLGDGSPIYKGTIYLNR